MKTPSVLESDRPIPDKRLLTLNETQEVLDMAQGSIDALNHDYYYQSLDQNPHSTTRPYESVALFTTDDALLTDRASEITYASSYDLKNNERLDFHNQTIANRRIILSQTALGAALKIKTPQFMTSLMNPDQQMWTHPLFSNDEQTAAVQLAFTINQNTHWNYPSSEAVEKIFKKHQQSLNKVAKALAELSLTTKSLSKSLEILPPINPNGFVVSWDIVNSTELALGPDTATYDKYLSTMKALLAKDTTLLSATVQDRGDGENVIVPMCIDLNKTSSIKDFGARTIRPLVLRVQEAHNAVAFEYRQTIAPQILVRVGIGNFEEDEKNLLNSQAAITETVKRSEFEPDSNVGYTKKAREILFPT